MGKSDPDAVKSTRKRQLNVIYFVDSARTRSFTVPILRLNLALFMVLGLLTWTAASTYLVVLLVKSREDTGARLRAALATVFDYETRDNNVFDIAYPPANKALAAHSNLDAAPGAAGAPKKSAAVPAVAPAAAGVPPAGKSGSVLGGADVALANPPEAAQVPTSATGDEDGEIGGAATQATAPVDSAVNAKNSGATGRVGAEGAVEVSNPIVEAKGQALHLRFDLTTKGANDHSVEGYIYAVAEYKPDSGERLFIGAPIAIAVDASSGLPGQPLQSSSFSIRHFKQKSFTFPFTAVKAGTFTGVRIGVLDKSGGSKSTYNVPVKIRVGSNLKDEPAQNATPVPSSQNPG